MTSKAKQEAIDARESFTVIVDGLTKRRLAELVGEINEVALFLEKVERVTK